LNHGNDVKVGSKEWWVRHIEVQNSKSLVPKLEIVKVNEQEDFPCSNIAVKSRVYDNYPVSGRNELTLKNNFEALGLFSTSTAIPNLSLGKYSVRADFVGMGFDGSYWVIEYQIVEAKRGIGEMKRPIIMTKIGEAIGQAVLYSQLWKKKVQPAKVMPAVVTWSLGSGRADVLAACRRIGVTFITLDKPVYLPYGNPSILIYYLEKQDPLPFCDD